MKEALIKLLKVKTILSILFSVTTCILAFKQVIEMETFMAITMAIITFYFTKDNGKEE